MSVLTLKIKEQVRRRIALDLNSVLVTAFRHTWVKRPHINRRQDDVAERIIKKSTNRSYAKGLGSKEETTRDLSDIVGNNKACCIEYN